MTLLASAGASAVTAVALGSVAVSAARPRPPFVAPDTIRAAFITWWGGAALALVLDATARGLLVAGVTATVVFVALKLLAFAALTGAMWGLITHIVYVWTGKGQRVWPIAVVYAAFFSFVATVTAVNAPYALAASAWTVTVTPASAAGMAWMEAAFVAFVAGPVTLAAVAYGVLAVTLPDPPRRYRAALVAVGLGQWVAAGLVGHFTGWAAAGWYPLLVIVPGLLAAVLLALAYFPPAWVDRFLAARRFARALNPRP